MTGDTHTFRVLFKDQDRLKRLEEEVPAPWSPPAWSRPFEVKIKDDDDAAMFRIRFAAEIEAAAVHDANVLSMQITTLAGRVMGVPLGNAGVWRARAVLKGTDEHK